MFDTISTGLTICFALALFLSRSVMLAMTGTSTVLALSLLLELIVLFVTRPVSVNGEPGRRRCIKLQVPYFFSLAFSGGLNLFPPILKLNLASRP